MVTNYVELLDVEDEALICIDGGPEQEGCSGPVEWRVTPDRRDGRAFARCLGHFEKRLATAERNMELLSDVPPPWFDPSYAGERWDEDY